MAPYATVNEFITQYTLAEAAMLTNLDRPSAAGLGEVDEAVLARAQEDASYKIDSYIGVFKSLANPPVFFTAQLRRCCNVYARDFLSIHGNDEVVQRQCEDCDRWLRDVRDGKLNLGLSEADSTQQTSGGGVYVAPRDDFPLTKALKGY